MNKDRRVNGSAFLRISWGMRTYRGLGPANKGLEDPYREMEPGAVCRKRKPPRLLTISQLCILSTGCSAENAE
jgi:hypothetical protein